MFSLGSGDDALARVAELEKIMTHSQAEKLQVLEQQVRKARD